MWKSFIVVEEDAVVSEDLREALSERFSNADVSVFSALGVALDHIATLNTPPTVLINWPYRELLESGIDSLVHERGGRIVVTRGPGRDVEMLPQHWIKLPAPFSTDIMLNAVS